MIFDTHVHTFPDDIAVHALNQLSESAGIVSYGAGTISDLRSSMKNNNIDIAILLPVATNPKQYEGINRLAISLNEHGADSGIYSAGAIHPDNTNYKTILKHLSSNGVKGIKLHPVFQGVPFDDIRYLRIVESACECDLSITIHGGYDISNETCDYASPARIRKVIDELHPNKLIVAHMGGWNCWDEAEKLLVGQDLYLDTSFCLNDVVFLNGERKRFMNNEQFVRIVKNHGSRRILFGSDSPWCTPKEAIRNVRESGLHEEEIENILSLNALRLYDSLI